MSNERITLWYFIPALAVGGAERTLVSLANNLDHGRYDVTIWTIFEQNPLADEVADEVTVRTLGAEGVVPENDPFYVERAADPSEYVRAPLRFLRAVRAGEPDILQSFLIYDNIIATIAGVVSPETTVLTGVRSVPNDSGLGYRLLGRLAFSLSDAVVSNSAAGATYARNHGASANRTHVVRNGRDLDEFREASADGLRQELDLPTEGPIVGTVGRLIERKGHHDLLRAWPRIYEEHPSARLLLVGDGPRRDALREFATNLGCRESIRFLGLREDVPRLLDMFDVFVFPSHFEGLPGALIEAMAAGLPIVTTPVDGNAELVENYRTGLYVHVREPDQIAWAVSRLIDHPSFARTLGEAARTEATERFTVRRMVGEFETLYESLAPGTARTE